MHTDHTGHNGTDASALAITSVPRVVLDSNIWVDLLVFRDPHVEPIRTALAAGAIAPVIRADCREELRRVLAYPQFARFAVDIDAALAEVDRLATLEPAPAQEDADAIRLPRCKDTDDQKFIELAHFSRAALLVSKDKAVLKLRSRLRRSSGVEVLPPLAFAGWLAAWVAPA
jgi:putative PIN family toxin of toxin-antitoxin system